MIALITVGTASSGKSTYAKELVKRGYIQIERDDIRAGISDQYVINAENELAVDRILSTKINEAFSAGKNIVLSDGNLDKGNRDRLIQKLKSTGFSVRVKVFFNSIEQSIEWDSKREKPVGADVIKQQHQMILDQREELTRISI